MKERKFVVWTQGMEMGMIKTTHSNRWDGWKEWNLNENGKTMYGLLKVF